MIAKLRLTGSKFDQDLSTEALQALSIVGPDPVRDQLYAAAKAEPLIAGGELTAISLGDALNVKAAEKLPSHGVLTGLNAVP